MQLCDKISDLLSSMGQTPESFTGRNLFMSMFNDIFCDRYDNKDECFRNANIVRTFAGRFGIGQWSFIGPGSEKKWYPSENSPQGAWDHIAEDMLLQLAESGHPIFRATTPLSRGQLKSKGRVKGMNPAPHIHEHLQYTIMATSMRPPSRITTSRLSTLR